MAPILSSVVLLFVALDPGVPSEPHVSPDGTIEVRLLAPTSMDAVRAVLEDPVERSRLVPGIRGVEVLGRQGACVDLRVTTEGAFSPYVYDTRACPTAEGWQERMLRSEDMEEVVTTWRLKPTAAGVEVAYQTRVKLRIPIPRALLVSAQCGDMVQTLERLWQRLR